MSNSMPEYLEVNGRRYASLEELLSDPDVPEDLREKALRFRRECFAVGDTLAFFYDWEKRKVYVLADKVIYIPASFKHHHHIYVYDVDKCLSYNVDP